MLERHARLDGALAVARHHEAPVDRAPAGEWLRRQLSGSAPEGVLTLVWHSVTRMYWPKEESVVVERAVDDARARMPIPYLTMEHPWPAAGVVTAKDEDLVPRIELDGEVIGTCGHHGPPLRLGG
jgi:hypothetical protein